MCLKFNLKVFEIWVSKNKSKQTIDSFPIMRYTKTKYLKFSIYSKNFYLKKIERYLQYLTKRYSQDLYEQILIQTK